MADERQDGSNSLPSEEREIQLRTRRVARERVRVIGLLVILFCILMLTFVRFGKHIPWGAR
jgi:hypothetical protein